MSLNPDRVRPGDALFVTSGFEMLGLGLQGGLAGHCKKGEILVFLGPEDLNNETWCSCSLVFVRGAILSVRDSDLFDRVVHI